MNLVEKAFHSFLVFVLAGVMVSYGLLIIHLPKDSSDPLMNGVIIGINLFIIWIALYFAVKIFYTVGSRVNL